MVYLYAADMVLEQGSGPSASGVSGELASAAAVSGTSDVAFGASDPGSGVYEAVISLDGEVVQSTVLDEDGGRCRNVGGTSDGLAAFLYVQPCPPSLSADVGLDTTRFANGSHHLVVSVVDAAGNSATVLDRNITIANPTSAGSAGSAGAGSAAGAAGAGTGAVGAANGTNASAQATLTAGWKGAKGSRLVSGYGRTETIAGRLTAPGGVPIGGAQIEVLATPAYTGARAVAMAGPHTAADGDFSLRIPAGASSRSLRLAYHSRLGEPAVAAARTLTLSVHAALALKISPRTASVGRRIYFSGRLLGGPVPAGGKLLVLEASSAGSWIEFNVIRSGARGRYHASYRFRFPGPVSYRFRVVSEAEADYPYATGASNVVAVREE